MIRKDLVRRLSRTTACHGISQNDLDVIVKELFSIMTNAFLEGEEVAIRGFGRFWVKYRKPYKINHPGRKEVVSSHPKYQVHFRPAKTLKDKLQVTNTDSEGI